MASASCSSASTVGRGGPRSAAAAPGGNNRKLMTCLCSPTNHPGSFRCSRHRNASPGGGGGEAGPTRPGSRAAANKGRSVRALLLQRIISGPGERRRRQGGDFQPRPSRLRLMNK